MKFYEALYARWGEQHWWPAQSNLEMILGAILTQNTAWTNVERAIENLKTEQLINITTLATVEREQLAQAIRPAGYFNQKSRTIQEMAQTLQTRFAGSLDQLFALETEALRTELLSWRGIGPETADSILLYAAKRPIFVIDAYTKRFLSRHGLCAEKAGYDHVAELFTDALPRDVQLYNEYHALIVRLGKEHCNPKPQCTGCPLEPFLPER